MLEAWRRLSSSPWPVAKDVAYPHSGLVVAKVILEILFKISIYCFVLFSEYASVNSIICSAKLLAITLLCIMLKTLEIASTTDCLSPWGSGYM